jgi:hypothetical protein
MAEEVKFENVLDQRVNSIPFEPFALSVTSGERFEIRTARVTPSGSDFGTLSMTREWSCCLMATLTTI